MSENTYKTLQVLKKIEERSDIRLETKRRLLNDAKRYFCKNDLFYLAKYQLGYEDLTFHYHKKLCDTLVHYKDDEQLHLHPRGHFKSTIITISEVIQDILNNPNISVLIVNAVLGKAKAFLKEIKSHFVYESEFLELFPAFRMKTKEDRGTQESFVSPARTRHSIREGTVEANGIDKAIVSAHYDKIVFDDVVNNINVKTPELRKKILDGYREYLSLLNPPWNVRIVGTRWDDDDLYGTLLNDNESSKVGDVELDFRIFKTRCYESDGYTPVFPERFNEKVLKKLKVRQGPYIFSCQYLNDPLPKERKVFEIANLRWCKKPHIPKNTKLLTFSSCDASTSDDVRHDPAVIVTAKVNCNKEIFITRIVRGWWKPDAFIQHLLDVAVLDRPIKLGFENTGFQKVYQFFVEEERKKRGVSLNIEEIKRHTRTSKVTRLERIQPYLNDHKIWIVGDPDEPTDEQLQLLNELDRFPTGKYDDILDCVGDIIEICHYPSKRPKKKLVYEVAKTGSPYRTGRSYRTVRVTAN